MAVYRTFVRLNGSKEVKRIYCAKPEANVKHTGRL
jgi:hypothetical protein